MQRSVISSDICCSIISLVQILSQIKYYDYNKTEIERDSNAAGF